MRDLGLPKKEDHGHDHRAYPQDAPVALHHLGTVGEHDHHTIAGLQAQAHQGMGDAGSGAVLIHVGDPAALEGEGFVLAVAPDIIVAEEGKAHGFLPHSF